MSSLWFNIGTHEVGLLDETLPDGTVFERIYVHDDDILMAIARMLKRYPHPNIVTVYRLGENFFDTELVQSDPHGKFHPLFIEIHTSIKDHLQRLGIYFNAWDTFTPAKTESGVIKMQLSSFEHAKFLVFDKEFDDHTFARMIK